MKIQGGLMIDLLIDINKRLAEIMSQLPDKQDELSDIQMKIDRKKSKLYLMEDVIGMKNAEMREAYVNSALDSDGLKEEFTTKLNSYKRISIEKDLLIEMSKNLRIILQGER